MDYLLYMTSKSKKLKAKQKLNMQNLMEVPLLRLHIDTSGTNTHINYRNAALSADEQINLRVQNNSEH